MPNVPGHISFLALFSVFRGLESSGPLEFRREPNEGSSPALVRGHPVTRAGVVVEFDLPSAETENHPPAVIDGKVFYLGWRHRFQNRELRRMGNETFRSGGKNPRYLIFDSKQIRVHR